MVLPLKDRRMTMHHKLVEPRLHLPEGCMAIAIDGSGIERELDTGIATRVNGRRRSGAEYLPWMRASPVKHLLEVRALAGNWILLWRENIIAHMAGPNCVQVRVA